MAARLRGLKQRKLNDHVYSFLLFVSSKPRYQAEFQYIESGLLQGIEAKPVHFRITCFGCSIIHCKKIHKLCKIEIINY